MIEIILIFGDLIYIMAIGALGYAARCNLNDYRIAFIIATIIVSFLIAAIPSMMEEVGLLQFQIRFYEIDLVLKLISLVLTLNFAQLYFRNVCVCNAACILLASCAKFLVCKKINESGVSAPMLINLLKEYDSSFIDPHYPFIVGNALLILIFMSVNHSALEIAVSGGVCLLFFGVGIYRMKAKTNLQREEILCLIGIELIIIMLCVFNQRLITYIMIAEFYVYIRKILKKRAEEKNGKEN